MKKLFVVIVTVLMCSHVAVNHQKAQAGNTGKYVAASVPGTANNAVKAASDAICGTYLVISPKNKEDKIKVKLYRTDNGTYAGRIIWLQPDHNPDGTERTDLLNKNPKLRSRKATDITLCWNLEYDAGENIWKDGSLYDPTTGKTFGIQLKIAANGKDIDARYYKGKPVFGIDQKWTKYNVK